MRTTPAQLAGLALLASTTLALPAQGRLGHGIAVPRPSTAPAFDAELSSALQALLQLKPREQEAILRMVRDAADKLDTPYLRSIRRLTTEARGKFKPRLKRGARHANWSQRKGGDPTILDGLPFPVANQYEFGRGTLIPAEYLAGEEEMEALRSAGKKTRTKSKPRRRPSSSAKGLQEPPPYLTLCSMLRGYPADADLCLAAMQRRLDSDRRADAFSVFLEGWRNGPESFYRALDRTAGTNDSVFFYDAMLGEFIQKCVPKQHADYKRIRRSTDVAHDALHNAFLAYRQYRALRECAALALLLPRDHKLPGSLERYETMESEGYSVRDTLDLLLDFHDQDLEKVLDIIVASAPPLPDPLWTGKYDPIPALYAEFTKRLPEMTKTAHTDALLVRQKSLRRQEQANYAKTARVAFLRAMQQKHK